MIIRKLETVGLFDENLELENTLVGLGCATLSAENLKQDFNGGLKDFISEISKIGKAHNTIVQLYDLKLINSLEHLYSAVLFGERGFKHEINISNQKALEYLLYASLQRQIKIAIELLGLKLIQQVEEIPIAISITGKNQKDIQSSANKLISKFKIEISDTHKLLKRRDKLEELMNVYEIEEFEVKNALSLIKKRNVNMVDAELESLQSALDLILKERMSLLSLENVSI